LAAERRNAAPAAPEDPDVLLEREQRERPRAVVAAAVGALLPLAGTVISFVIQGDIPNNDPGVLLYVDDHAATVVVSSALIGFGTLAIGVVLAFLYGATRGRRPQLPRLARSCAMVAPIVLLVALLVGQIGLVVQAHDFATTGNQTYQEAKDALGGPVLAISGPLRLAAQLALGFAFAIISLNAMRAGLLSRFMGVLGVISGVLFVIPLGSPLPIVQTFWLGALAFLFAGRWPSGTPPAWERGEAVPWPSQQELRERAERERAGPEPSPEPAAATVNGPSQPSSKKRKRKRRN
jgi:hypothetical protein